LNRLQLPTDVLSLIVLLRLRFKLSARDLAEFLLLCCLVFSRQAVHNWEAKLAPLLAVARRCSAAALGEQDRSQQVRG